MTDAALNLVDTVASQLFLYGPEEVDPDLLDFTGYNTVDALVEWRNNLAGIGQAVKLIRGAVDSEIAGRLGDGGSARFGDTVYRVYPAGKWKAHDPKGLASWVAQGNKGIAQRIHAVYGGTVRVKAIRALAQDDSVGVQGVVETFLEKVNEEPKLHALPRDKAPVWLQKLREGEVWDVHAES